MRKVILVCNAGMSTGILAKRIEEASNGELDVKAYGEAEFADHLEGVELILVGPQLRHQIPTIKKQTTITVQGIPPQYYGLMDGKGVYNEIKKILG